MKLINKIISSFFLISRNIKYIHQVVNFTHNEINYNVYE